MLHAPHRLSERTSAVPLAKSILIKIVSQIEKTDPENNLQRKELAPAAEQM